MNSKSKICDLSNELTYVDKDFYLAASSRLSGTVKIGLSAFSDSSITVDPIGGVSNEKGINYHYDDAAILKQLEECRSTISSLKQEIKEAQEATLSTGFAGSVMQYNFAFGTTIASAKQVDLANVMSLKTGHTYFTDVAFNNYSTTAYKPTVNGEYMQTSIDGTWKGNTLSGSSLLHYYYQFEYGKDNSVLSINNGNAAVAVTIRCWDVTNGMRYEEPFKDEIPAYAFVNYSSYDSSTKSIWPEETSRIHGEFNSDFILGVGDFSFENCTSLSIINLSSCYSFGSQVFKYVKLYKCTLGITTIDHTSMYFKLGFLGYNYIPKIMILPSCVSIGERTFATSNTIQYVEAPNCKEIGLSAFYNCTSLTEIVANNCQSIGESSFENCTSLTEIVANNCQSIGDFAFYNCSSLLTINIPKCKTINKSTFVNCNNLNTVFLNECSSINYLGISVDWLTNHDLGAFANCNSLSSIYLSNCLSIDAVTFLRCTNLKNITLDNCKSLNDTYYYNSVLRKKIYCAGVFNDCSNLSSINLPKCEFIGANTFCNCTALSSIYITNTTITKLRDTTAFDNTPIANGTGTVYVPASLLEQYKTDSVWSQIADRISAV